MANESKRVFVVSQDDEVKSVHSKALSADIAVELSPGGSYKAFSVLDGPFPIQDNLSLEHE